MRRKALIIIAPPGGGKDELARKLAEHGFIPCSTGSVCRARAAADPQFNVQYGKKLASRALLPDEVVLPIVESFLFEAQGDIVFNGFPRTLSQARFLIEKLADFNYHVHVAILVNLTAKICYSRVTDSHKPGGKNDRGNRSDDFLPFEEYEAGWKAEVDSVEAAKDHLIHNVRTIVCIDGTDPAEEVLRMIQKFVGVAVCAAR